MEDISKLLILNINLYYRITKLCLVILIGFLQICVGVLPFLMRISLQLNEEMAPLIVKLITTALSGVPFHSKTDSHKHSHQNGKGTSKSSDSSTKAESSSVKQPGMY